MDQQNQPPVFVPPYGSVFLHWLWVFPLHLCMTLGVVTLQLIAKIFNMPFDVWNEIMLAHYEAFAAEEEEEQ